MNKQEAIKEIKNIGTLKVNDRVVGQQVDFVVKNQVLDIVSKISDSQKVVVPKFVADWVANSRDCDYEFCDFFDSNNQSEEVYRWLNCENRRKSELNALALSTLIVHGRDAVIVEEEPRYMVKVKGIDGYYAYLDKELRTSKWIFGTIDNFANHRTHHTRKELEEAGFGWVFDCDGIEIEEIGTDE